MCIWRIHRPLRTPRASRAVARTTSWRCSGEILEPGALGPLQQDLSTCGAAVVMSSDGRSLYTSSGDFGSTVGTLARNRTTGLLTRAGCVGHQSRGCRQVRHVNAPDALAIDGNRYVYVLSNDPVEGSTIGVFRRSLR